MSTRDRFIHSATDLFWRHGYSAVSVDAICEAAGRPKGSFYHAFSSKEEVLVETIKYLWADNRKEILSSYDDEREFEEKFKRHLEWFGMNQRRLRAKMGFVPGSFNMSLEIGTPTSALKEVKRCRNDHAEIMLKSVSHFIGLSTEDDASKLLTVTVDRFVSGAMIDARAENSLDPFLTLPESILELLRLVPSAGADSSRAGALRGTRTI
jgi:AcrR family transcriptional regulator